MNRVMRSSLGLFLSVVMLIMCAAPASAVSLNGETDEDANRSLSMLKLSVEIVSDKTSYEANEKPVFTVTIKNRGDTPVYDVKLVSFADSALSLETGSSSIVVGAIDSGKTATVILNAAPAVYAQYEQESVNAVFSSFGQVFSIVKMMFAFLFDPFMTNINSCNVNIGGSSQGILSLAYGFTRAGTAVTSDEPNVINDNEIDTDKDGLTDVQEKLHGTSIFVVDTDDDGFSDYQEVVLMDTDPLVMDDPGEDTDGDGLIDYDEVFTYNTNIKLLDSDEDGLGDYDEVFEYKTDPASADTDDDGLTDGFEVEKNLNPNKKSTNGVVLDGELVFKQNLSVKRINPELMGIYNLAKPGVSGTAKGELNENVVLELCDEFALVGNHSVIGMPVDVIAEDDYVDGLTISFALTEYDGDLSSLVICTFDEDGKLVRIPSSLFGVVLSCEMIGSGAYFVLDNATYIE